MWFKNIKTLNRIIKPVNYIFNKEIEKKYPINLAYLKYKNKP